MEYMDYHRNNILFIVAYNFKLLMDITKRQSFMWISTMKET
jgi:hypothetical protein